MHAVVNELTFAQPVDAALFLQARDEMEAAMRAVPGFEAFHVVRTSDTTAVLLIVAASAETLDRLATEVGSPWMRAHVVPLLAAPPGRQVGEIVASTLYR